MPIRFQLVLAALPALLACASGSGFEAPRTSSNVITRAELAEIDVRNAYEAVHRLRPRWLLVRGGPRSFSSETDVVVFQDETFLGTLDALERLGTEGIYTIRYLDGPTAQATLSGIRNRHIQGAIVVSLRPPERRDDASQGD